MKANCTKQNKSLRLGPNKWNNELSYCECTVSASLILENNIIFPPTYFTVGKTVEEMYIFFKYRPKLVTLV